MDQDRNVGKRFSRERFRIGGFGMPGAFLLVLAVMAWIVYSTGFLKG